MTEEQYEERRAAIMRRVYVHSETFANRKPKYPLCLKADLKELEKLDKEWRLSNENK